MWVIHSLTLLTSRVRSGMVVPDRVVKNIKRFPIFSLILLMSNNNNNNNNNNDNNNKIYIYIYATPGFHGGFCKTTTIRQLSKIYIYIYIYIYIFNSWNLDCDPWVSWCFFPKQQSPPTLTTTRKESFKIPTVFWLFLSIFDSFHFA